MASLRTPFAILVAGVALSWFGAPVASAELESAGEAPAYDSVEADAPPVTAATLLENEKFWPLRVTLTEPAALKPPPMAPTPVGRTGVLVRVVSPEVVRVDFGRDGRAEIALAATDVVARANDVRTGKLRKGAPNLLSIMGSQIVDARDLNPITFADASGFDGFLCVFADPKVDEFDALADSLRGLRQNPRVLTTLFAEGDHPPRTLASQLHERDWIVKFVFDHMAEGLARALMPEGAEMPTVLLLSPEGRVLFHQDWRASDAVGLATALQAAVDAAFGASTVAESASNEAY